MTDKNIDQNGRDFMVELETIDAVKKHFNWSPYSKERWATHNLSSLNLVEFINSREPNLVVDIGCGKNNFKGLVPNVIGIDVADYPEADLNLSLEQVYEQGIIGAGSADVVLALGSLNFGTWEHVKQQFRMAIDFVRPGGVFVVRVRLHLSRDGAKPLSLQQGPGRIQHNWNWEYVAELHELYKDQVDYLVEPALEKAARGAPMERHGEPDFTTPPINLAVWTWIKK